MLLYALILFILLCILSVLAYFGYRKERFTETPLLTLQVERDPNTIRLFLNNLQVPFTNDVPNVSLVKNMSQANAIATDVFTYQQEFSSLTGVTVLRNTKKCLIVKVKDARNNESLKDVINRGETIGIFDNTSALLLKYICMSLGVDATRLMVKKVNSFLNNDVYATFACAAFEDPGLKIDPYTKIDFLNYEGMDIHKLKFLLPYARVVDYDLAVPFPNFKDKFSIKSCLQLDTIIAGKDDLKNLNLSRLLVANGNHDTINYYTQYITFFDQTMNYLKRMNEHVQNRDSLPILEQFIDPIDIVVDDLNIDGYYNANTRTFELSSDVAMIKDLPLVVGSKVVLKSQDREEENGTYKVVVGKRMQKAQAIPKPQENPTYDNRYECYDQPLIKNRGLCISNYDATGKSPKPVMIWDRRCERNEECPFYQANKNYKNYFGGCIDGYCQVPVGVTPLGYRQYDTGNQPFCHGCKDPSTPFCCEHQRDKSKYPHLSSPDYAFPLDEHARNRFSRNMV